MAEYKWLEPNTRVKRIVDGSSIPNEPANRDWQEFQKWRNAGNVPDPADPPKSAAAVLAEDRAAALDLMNNDRSAQMKLIRNGFATLLDLINDTRSKLSPPQAAVDFQTFKNRVQQNMNAGTGD